MKDDVTRIAQYNAKTVATTVGLKVASMLPTMKVSFAAMCNSFVAKEIAIQGQLNTYGDVPTIQYPFYINYGREIWGLNQRGIVGPTAVFMAISLTTKYTSYGLNSAHLKDLAVDVFNIIIP
jgi:hypothetical protein